jgi:hypothetical protein
LAAGVTLGVGLAIAAGLMAGAREHLQELQRGTVEALAAAIASDLDRVGPDGSALRAVLVPMARAADARQRAWQLVVQDATGAPLANLAAAVPLSGAAVVATRQVAAGPLAGARVTVTMADTTDRNLALLVGGLMAGLVIGLLLGLEVLTFLAARLLVAPAREPAALASWARCVMRSLRSSCSSRSAGARLTCSCRTQGATLTTQSWWRGQRGSCSCWTVWHAPRRRIHCACRWTAIRRCSGC